MVGWRACVSMSLFSRCTQCADDACALGANDVMLHNNQKILTFLRNMGVKWVYQDAPRSRYHEKIVPFDAPKTIDTHNTPFSQKLDIPMPKIQPAPLSHPAYQCKNLDDLKSAVEAFDECVLKKTALNTVFSDGPRDAKLMLIGEAPGADEDAQGKPFVGMSGQLLNKMMAAIGLHREHIYISNIIPWRPPGNRPPSTQEIVACLPFIEQHIVLKKPKYILLLGGTATKALFMHRPDLKGVGIMRLRGKWQDYRPPNAPEGAEPFRVLPTFHPAFLLRSPNQKVHAWEDLKTLKHALDEEEGSANI